MTIKTKVILIVFVLLISGCSTGTASVEAPLIVKTLTPTISPIPSSTTQIIKTITPTTLISSEEPTPSSTITSTYTPQPTLTLIEAKMLILELMQQNGGCMLPCLWGFTPGRTELETVHKYIKRFGTSDVRLDGIQLGVYDYGDSGSVGISYPENTINIVISWSFYKSRESSQLELITMKARPMENKGINPVNKLPIMSPMYGDPTFSQVLSDYLLQSILTTHGQPTHVLLNVRPDEKDDENINWYPFSLVLIYQDQGIFIEYVSTRETIGSNYIGCPDNSHIYLAVWNPEDEMQLDYLVEKAGSEITMSALKPIEKATSMTIEEYFGVFKNPNNKSCLESPINLWTDD